MATHDSLRGYKKLMYCCPSQVRTSILKLLLQLNFFFEDRKEQLKKSGLGVPPLYMVLHDSTLQHMLSVLYPQFKGARPTSRPCLHIQI